MADQPEGTYALGIFCTLVEPYMSGVSHTKNGFMRDFFDTVMDKTKPFEETAKRMRAYLPGKTSITVGVWAGTNKTDLVKLFSGKRKLAAWKASDFHTHLDQEKVADMCDPIGIDALGAFQKELAWAGLRVDSVAEIPHILGTWLELILRSNMRDRDLHADGPTIQPELDVFESVPLAEGRISGGKLHLGSSTIPWKKPPAVPSTPDPELESGYLTQMYAAFSDHLGTPVSGSNDLPKRFQKAFDRQRGYFYDAEGVRRNLRDVVDTGEEEFNALKDDLYDGVCGVCEADYDDGLARMNTTLTQAANYQLNGSVITKFPTIIKGAEKQGMCHMLVNDERLQWVGDDDDESL